jgi:hypothetical protein
MRVSAADFHIAWLNSWMRTNVSGGPLHFQGRKLRLHAGKLWHLHINLHSYILQNRKICYLRGFSPHANYTDRATAACRRS